ncbi:hypothetical protein Y032_0441g1522 [Ancylostoma ceylanicum]|uniref:G-protein coupled receptors family 1 profile domain-containing protein n=1 Tax=Ancylostoma ceylanicum TaxID=53326 RepID=A0A016WZQ4_9BILA|nr:hypothetical protein Y032_0441g1522 [Ancylostoma ceylanicum]
MHPTRNASNTQSANTFGNKRTMFRGQFPALVNLSISLERILALEFAGWYHRMWRASYKTYLVFAAVIFTFTFFLLAVLVDIVNPIVYSTRICTVLNSTGIIYGTVHYTLIAITYFVCFIVLAVIFHKNNKRRAPPKEEERRQRMILTITGISVLLVSIPCLFMVIDEWGIPRINELITGVAYCLYGVHSSLSLIVYTVFRPDFREQLLSLVGLHKSANTEAEKNSSQRGAFKPQVANHIHVLSRTITGWQKRELQSEEYALPSSISDHQISFSTVIEHVSYAN